MELQIGDSFYNRNKYNYSCIKHQAIDENSKIYPVQSLHQLNKTQHCIAAHYVINGILNTDLDKPLLIPCLSPPYTLPRDW